MRRIGTLDQRSAEKFAAFLSSQGIAAEAQKDEDGWAIWVRNENDVPQSTEHLRHFLTSPEDARYGRPGPPSESRESPSESRESPSESSESPSSSVSESPSPAARATIFGGKRGYPPAAKPPSGPAPLSASIVSLAVLVTVMAGFSLETSVGRLLAFCDVDLFRQSGGDPLVNIHAGQLWRILTPIFLHLDLIHLLLNVVVFRIFAARIERLQGVVSLALLVLAIGLVSNAAQALAPPAETFSAISGTPLFGGLSAVIYGLIGFVWVRMFAAPASGYQLDTKLIFILVTWFLYCLLNEQQQEAGVAYGSGLVVGMAAGSIQLWNRRLGNNDA